jgi:PAS domain S-box-containing protein
MMSNPSPPHRRILIVDDNPEDRAELRRLLITGADRHDIFEEVDSLAAAAARVGERRFDCVLLDQYLPDGLGTDLIGRLSSAEGSIVPLVVVTADTTAELNRRALRVGAEDFVSKSWMTPEIFSRVVDNAIERWTMARELRASEARFRQLAAAVPQPVWMADRAGRLQYANARWREYFGALAEDCERGDWRGTVHPDDRPLELASREADDPTGQHDCRLRRADGEYRWHQVNVVAIRDELGEVQHWYGVNTDIHERKLAEQRLAVEHAVSRQLARARDLDEVAPGVLATLARGLDAEICTFWVVEGEALRCAETFVAGDAGGAAFAAASRALRCPLGHGLPGQVWATREVQWRESLADSPRAREAAAAGIRCAIACPISAGDELLGVLELFGVWPGAPDRKLLEMLAALGSELGQFLRRTRTERVVEDNQARLRLALEASGIGLWTWELATDRVEWTADCYRIHGLSADQFAGTGAAFFALVHPDDRDRVETTVRAAISTHSRYWCEFRVVRPSGAVIWVENLGRASYAADGTPLGILGSLRDIDDRKRVADRLRDSEERFVMAQRAARVGVWDWNVITGVATWTDQAWELFAGTPPQADTVSYERWIACLHPEDRERAAAAVRAGLESGSYRDRFRVQHGDGVVRWVEVVADATRGRDGAPERLTGTARDVTAEQVAGEAVRAALEQSERAVRSRDQLMTLVSHDLRGPISSLSLELEILTLQRDVLVAAAPGFSTSLERMQRQVRTMTQMIEELLDAALLQAGKPLALDRRDVDLVELTRAVVAVHQRTARGHQLELRASVDRLIGRWDGARVERAVSNLVSNAIKYSPQGGKVEIELEAAAREVAVLRIRDQGIGIPQADLQRVFEWFGRADNAARSKIAGTGVGLAATKQIIEQHGGVISVDSSVGRGSTFIIELPLR